MSRNKFFSILVISLIAVMTKAQADDSTKFVPVYTDTSNNLEWSKALPGKYSNGCRDASGNYDVRNCRLLRDANGYNIKDSEGNNLVRVEDSGAAKACRKINARLPTISDYKSLLRNFEHSEYDCNYDESRKCLELSNKGRADMNILFRDMYDWFWSSSVLPNDSYYALHFFGNVGDVVSVSRNVSDVAVRCVR